VRPVSLSNANPTSAIQQASCQPILNTARNPDRFRNRSTKESILNQQRIRAPKSFRHQDRQTGAATKFTRGTLAAGIAMGVSTAIFLPPHASAQTVGAATAQSTAQNPAQVAEEQLPAVTVYEKAIDPNPDAEPGAPYKARTSADTRHTRPLAETPQTISVITKAAIDDSGLTDLKQILDAQPGITLGTGENGNAFGDRYIIRGQEARSDVFVDGLRDPGMTTRESFAIEQLELSKGPNSSFAGRGTAGGAINAITKQA
jgi:catecholate siderophore receptor